MTRLEKITKIVGNLDEAQKFQNMEMSCFWYIWNKTKANNFDLKLLTEDEFIMLKICMKDQLKLAEQLEVGEKVLEYEKNDMLMKVHHAYKKYKDEVVDTNGMNEAEKLAHRKTNIENMGAFMLEVEHMLVNMASNSECIEVKNKIKNTIKRIDTAIA